MIKKFIMMVVLTVSIGWNCQTVKGANSNMKYERRKEFIIDSGANLYKNNDGNEIKKKLDFFEPVTILSISIGNSDRVKIQLDSGEEGWVQKKYTSIIPEDWIKLDFTDKYFCFIPPDHKFDYKQDLGDDEKFEYYINQKRKYEISLGTSRRIGYKEKSKAIKEFMIDYELNNNNPKELNWIKDFVYGDYNIKYVITTFGSGESGMYFDESFYYIKTNEIDDNKYYEITIGVHSKDKNDLLIYRKILFSVLKSFK